jgi:hypothetical protein
MLSAPFPSPAVHQRSGFSELGSSSRSRYYNRPAFLLAPDSPEGIVHYGSTSVCQGGMAAPMVQTSLYSSSLGYDTSKTYRPPVAHDSRQPRSPYTHLLRSSRGLSRSRSSERRSLRGMKECNIENPSTTHSPLAHDCPPFPCPPTLADIQRMEPELSPTSMRQRASDVDARLGTPMNVDEERHSNHMASTNFWPLNQSLFCSYAS